LHLEVPIASFPQRGTLTYNARLVYDSSIWIPWDGESIVQWPVVQDNLSARLNNFLDPSHGTANMGGWRLVISNSPDSDSVNSTADHELCDPAYYPQVTGWTTWSGFSWRDPEGAVHSFDDGYGTMMTASIDNPGVPNCTPYGNKPNTSGYATDGSGLFMVVTNYTEAVVYDKSGNQVFPTAKDSNGNYFSKDANGNVIDTLGRAPIIVTTNGDQIFYDVLNSQGGRSRYTVITSTVPVSVPNNTITRNASTGQVTSTTNGTYSTTMKVVQSITQPNGATYTFGYDQGNTGSNWGFITSIGLPTGGQVAYTYVPFPAPVPLNGTAALHSVGTRTSGGGTWHFSPAFGAGSQPGHLDGIVMTVTKPSGDMVVYKSKAAAPECQYLNTERDYFDSNSVLLKQELVEYVGACSLTQNYAVGVVRGTAPSRVTTVTPGGSGISLSKKTEYSYVNSPSNSDPTTISEWNYYSGTAPNVPDRVTQGIYSLSGNTTLAGAHIIDKPLTVTLSDGSGSQIAQTTYIYDNYSSNSLASTDVCQSTSASQPSPAAPQHDYQAYCTSNTVRGNLTQVSKWLNTANGSITTTTNTYDDTGNVVATKDALSNPTSIQFSPSFGLAYPTKITNALGQVTTKDYDFNTGLPISETDPNGQTTGLKTTYHYDGMDRLVETDFPDGSQSTTNFNGDAVPLTITTTQVASPDPSIIKTTVLDGLGRTQTECLSDPEGNDCVDTAYDSNGRVSSKSNPHRTAASASDGVTYFQYDGLDRLISTTEPDGNIVLASYDTQSNPVLAQTVVKTDETGSQLRTATDGFGRLVEADEPGDASPGKAAGGSLAINGNLQNKPATSGTAGTGWVTVSGAENSTTVAQPCTPDMTVCDPGYTVWDYGRVVVTVNGFQATYLYGENDTPSTIASGLAAALNGGSSPVTATAGGATLSMTSKASGSATNYSLSASSATDDLTDFGVPSFTASASGSSLTGGVDGTPAVSDSGTVTVSVGSNSATASYGNGTGQDTSAAAVASDLAGKLTTQNPPFTVTASAATLIFNWKSPTAAGNVAVTVSSSTNQTAYFSVPSFAACTPITANPQNCSTALTNGADPYPSGLAHPYVSHYFYDLLDNLTCVEQHGDATGSGCGPAVLGPSDAIPAADVTSPWRIRRFVYDSLSRLVKANDPESGLTVNNYDNNGNLISLTDARGITINYSAAGNPIDPLNRVTGITYSDGTPSVIYHYDASCCGVNSLNPIGRLTSANTSNTELVFSYDPMGRIKTQWDCPPSGIARGSCYVISALYDAAGQVTSLTYPDGRTVTTSYSAAGRMTGVNLASFGGTGVNVPYYTVPQTQSPTSWGYWPSGAMNRGTFGNEVVETRGYGSRLMISSIADTKGTQTLLSKTYGLYDASNHSNGNILSINDGLNNAKNQTYTYDSLNRLLSGVQADNTFNISYSYDPWGNMKQSGTSNFQPFYDVRNRIQSLPYDAAGNLLNDGFHAYAYDGAGRMKNVDNSLASYTYNALDRRVRKDTSTSGAEYFFFGEDIIAELNPASGAWTDYVFGYDGRIAKDTSVNGTGAQYFHTDQVKSTRLVTDSNGGVVWQATYSPFGQELSAQNNAITFQFAGLQYDSEDSLNHADYRQYASSQGRWLSPDPHLGSFNPQNPQSANRYVYSLNNPLLLRDPRGLDPCDQSDEPVVAGIMPMLLNGGLNSGSMLLLVAPDTEPLDDPPCLTPPPPNPPEIDPCQRKGENCHQQELADSVGGGLAIHDPSCLLSSLREVVASGETPGEPNNGYGTLVGGTVIAAPPAFQDLIGTRNAHIPNPEHLTGHPHILVHVGRDRTGQDINSTAFGRYQFLAGTAQGLNMADFSAASQDAAADSLLRQRHHGSSAVDAASRGNIQSALAIAGLTWASMPGSPYNQRTVPLATAVGTFLNAAAGCHGTR
jgi:RHS repeat-associated protein